jgi:tetratricopeptide (TPR) repeat protein
MLLLSSFLPFQKGNDAFKKKDFQKALDFYTQSIKFKESAITYCNRATTYFKLNKYQEAELDATKCVTLDHTYAKGYARRGAARRGLKNFEGAVADFEKALTVAPNTKEYEKELEISKKALEEDKKSKSKRMIIEEEEEEPKPKPPKIIEEEEEIEELITPSASVCFLNNYFNHVATPTV